MKAEVISKEAIGQEVTEVNHPAITRGIPENQSVVQAQLCFKIADIA